MDPTSLPTDNLYKFWALACLLAMGALWYAMQKKLDRHGSERLKIKLEMVKQAEVWSFINRDRNAPMDRKYADEWLTHEREATIKDVELTRIAGDLDEKKRHLERAKVKTFGWLVVLFIATLVGFIFWYRNVQWFQDEVTLDSWREQKAKADLAIIELAKAKKATASTPTAHPSP